jgi:glycosyltransferase involved in cell wall biosynthesis
MTGLLLKKMKNVKWVTDFRDLWMGGDFFKPPKFYRALNKKLEKMAVLNSDFTTGVSKTIIEKYGRLRNDENVECIYNGFDPEDFPQKLDYVNEKVQLTFYGTVNDYLKPYYFIEILNNIIDKHPDIREKIELKIIGKDLSGDLKNKKGNGMLLNISGYLKHEKGIRELVKSDLILFTLDKNSSQGLITGRVFELIGSGKQVLAVVPDIEIKEILGRFKNVQIFSHEESDKVNNFITDYIMKKISIINHEQIWKRQILAEDYTRKASAEKFGMIFNKLTGN